jgi:hypothetical protein
MGLFAALRSKARSKRLATFRSFLSSIGTIQTFGALHPLKLIDIGGTVPFWEDCWNRDATSLTVVDFRQYDLVFSNSFFEHLTSWDAQASLAASILASGVPYFIQVPNKHSPVDPHFPFAPPFFASYPKSVQIRLCTLSSFGSRWRAPSLAAARRAAYFYNPLSRRDMRALYPDATIASEQLFYVPISILAYSNGR